MTNCCNTGNARLAARNATRATTLANDFNALVAQLFDGPLAAGCRTPRVMPMDIVETEKEWLLHAELPGFTTDQVNLQVEDGVLTITANADTTDEATTPTKTGEFVRRERAHCTVERCVRLPEGTAPDAVTAHMEHGVLTVTLPKPQRVLPTKIAVNAARN